MPRHEFVHPYYYDQLNNKDLIEIQEYISTLSDKDYKHNHIQHYDGDQDKVYEDYRSCEIHYPKKSSVFFRVGKKIFNTINKKYYRYDLRDVIEFQLIKYQMGGNYNWHIAVSYTHLTLPTIYSV